jgi:hypothetical protein
MGFEGPPYRHWIRVVIASTVLVVVPGNTAEAANEPCSGKKGGIAGCRGETFICNDGSVSASKKSCSAYAGGAQGLLGGAATPHRMENARAGEDPTASGLVADSFT